MSVDTDECSSVQSLRHGEDLPLVPISSESERTIIKAKYENVSAELLDPGLAEFLERLMELYEKYQETEEKMIERLTTQKEQLTSQAAQIEEATSRILWYSEELETKDQEILDIKKLVDASHIREQDSQETIEFLRGQIKKLETDIELKEQMQAEIDAEMGISGKTRESFNREKDRMTGEIQTLRNSVKNSNQAFSDLKLKYDKSNSKLVELQTQLNEKKDDLTRLLKIKAIAEKETEEARYQVNQLKRDIKLNETALENKARVIAKHESVIADMKNFIERVENENEELVQALKHEQEEVYLTNCRILEILDTNDEYARQFKIQENELVKLRKDLTQNANIQEVATRKVAASERAKDKVLMELEKARYATHVKAKELSTKEKEMHLSKRTTESLLREKEILNKNILRMAEMVRENLLKYQLESRLKKNLEVERDVFKKELGKIRLVMITLQKEKERLMTDNAQLTNKNAQSTQDIVTKQAEIYECKKVITELEIKVRQTTNTFEAVRAERNNLSHQLTETKDQLDEVRQKMKLINHQIEQLKEEVTTKELILKNSDLVVRKVNSEKDALSIELKRVKEALKMSRLTVEKMDEKEAKLEETIEKSEKENVALQKEIDRLVTNNGLLATQLDRRSTELSLMYDKIDVMQAVLGRGEEQYNQRLDDIKILKLEIKKIRNEKELLKRSFTNMADLRKEIYHLNRDLLNERQKCQTLEEEMQSPINFHRWRMLEGTDPEKKELIDKAQALQKRVTKLVDQDAENKFQIKNLTELYNSAVSGLKKMPGLEAKNEQEKARHLIKDKDTQLKVLASEMKVCEEQLEQYKVEVKNLKKEMNEVKKKYFALKLKDDKRKQKEAEENCEKRRNEEQSKLEKLAMGGGFSLVLADKRARKSCLDAMLRPKSR